MTTEARLRPGLQVLDSNVLQVHPENPRKGDVEHIAGLIKENGWHGVLVVQARTGRIVAGNHRFLAAQQVYQDMGRVPGLAVDPEVGPEYPCDVLDIDDYEALRIMLADNRASDLATYDEPGLLRLISMVGDADTAVAILTDPNTSSEQRQEALQVLRSSEYGGTGYTSEDVTQIAMGLLPETLQEKEYRTPEDMAAQYENTNVRQIMLIAGIGEYETLLVALRKVREDNGLDDNTEAVFWLMDKAGLVRKTALGWAPA